MNDPKPNEWITVADAATLIQKKPTTIYEWIKNGELTATVGDDNIKRVNGRRVLMIDASKRPGRPAGQVVAKVDDIATLFEQMAELMHKLGQHFKNDTTDQSEKERGDR